MKNEGKKWRRGCGSKVYNSWRRRRDDKKIETSGERRSLTELWDEKR
jgi:hypothetical protein